MARPLPSQNVRFLVVHCSDSPPDRGDTAADINRWHIERGFDLIGYHKVILPNGVVEPGRPEYVQGAHCKGHNHESLSICLIGRADFTPIQFKMLSGILRHWQSTYNGAQIVGHNQLDQGKTCPNFDVPAFVIQRGLA